MGACGVALSCTVHGEQHSKTPGSSSRVLPRESALQVPIQWTGCGPSCIGGGGSGSTGHSGGEGRRVGKWGEETGLGGGDWLGDQGHAHYEGPVKASMDQFQSAVPGWRCQG